MPFLYIDEEGSIEQSNEEPTSEDCQQIDDGTLTVVRFNSNKFSFESAVVRELTKEDPEEDIEFKVADWTSI